MFARLSGKQFTRFYSTNPKTSIKFFTKPDCMLCYEANTVLNLALDKLRPPMRNRIEPIDYIDITKESNKNWFECYRYDIPVLWIEREGYNKIVLMHKLDLNELVEELDQEM